MAPRLVSMEVSHSLGSHVAQTSSGSLFCLQGPSNQWHPMASNDPIGFHMHVDVHVYLYVHVDMHVYLQTPPSINITRQKISRTHDIILSS